MTDIDRLLDCYNLAYRIIPKPPKNDAMKVECEDPLAVVCLAELLYKWKYENKNKIPTK